MTSDPVDPARVDQARVDPAGDAPHDPAPDAMRTSTGSRGRPVRNWHASEYQHRTFGERAADRLRNGMGSWAFVFVFLVVMGVWAAVNTLPIKWDPYPFILLNLFLSMLAGLQGAILLIAAKRADAVSAALAQHDYDTNVAAKAEIEALMRINQQQVEMIADLRTLVDQNLVELRRLSGIERAIGERVVDEKAGDERNGDEQ